MFQPKQFRHCETLDSVSRTILEGFNPQVGEKWRKMAKLAKFKLKMDFILYDIIIHNFSENRTIYDCLDWYTIDIIFIRTFIG